jgi:hypothetical protein
MKTLKESILSDMDDTIKAGDDYIENVFREFEELKQLATKVKNFDGAKYSWRNKILTIRCPALLDFLGYDNTRITFYIAVRGTVFHNAWGLKIGLYNEEAGALKRSTDFISLSGDEYKNFRNVVIDYIKPIVNDINTFKKTLNNLIHKV